jgi:hypothetical protein
MFSLMSLLVTQANYQVQVAVEIGRRSPAWDSSALAGEYVATWPTQVGQISSDI